MKKENVYTSENSKKEVIHMTNIQAPINKTYFKQWNIFIILEGGTTTMYNEDGSTWEKPKAFTLKKIPMTDLRKYAGYESFADKANILYSNYSTVAYEKFYNEFQAYCDELKLKYNMQHKYRAWEYMTKVQFEEAKLHYGDIPQWVKELSDNQHKLLLDRARTCYGLEPEYTQLEAREFYRVPQQLVKDYNEYGEPEYYTAEELAKANFTVNTYNEVLGKFKFYSNTLNKVAEQAVIRDAKWFAQFNDTENDLRMTIEIEGDNKHNVMKPITCIEDTYLGRDEEYVDFQCDIYGLDENGDLFTSHKKFTWSED